MILYEYLRVAARQGRSWAHRVAPLLACCLLSQITITASAEENHRVLVLYEQGRSTAAVAIADREIREVLEKQTIYPIDLYVEYMDTNLFVDPASQQKIREWYLQKYRDHQPDVIIAGGNTPIHFMIDAQEKKSPGVPIVICGTTENWTNRPELDSLFTGTWMDPVPAKTLDLAVGGNVISYAAQGRIADEDVMKILGGVKPQNIPIVKGPNVYLFDWRALKRWGLKERNLPAESIMLNRQPALMDAYGLYVFGALLLLFVLLLLIFELLRQRAKERSIKWHLHESEARLREAQSIAQCGSWVWDIAKDKMYWSDEMYCILGLVPQSVTAEGRLIHPGDDQYYVAKMLEASDAHRPYTAEHRIVRPNGEERFVLESGQTKYDSQQKPVSMIGTMLDVTKQRQTEQALRESEERFRTMADGTPIMMWMAGVDKLCTDFNLGWLQFTGRSIEEEVGNGWADGVHPDDLLRCLRIYNEASDARRPFTIEYRLRRYDSQYHWISDTGSPRFLVDGTFAGYIGCCLDIHDRKAGELARHELARRLMGAQEAERSRIARELHDGIGQEIALLGIQMQRASTSIWPASGPRKFGMKEFSDKLAAIGVHVSRLSHQLHSSELEYLGLTAAITKLCREFSEQYPIKVTCTCLRIATKIDNDVALTFLRIIQESLHNVAKHSGAKTVQVEVTGTGEELRLSVRDDGTGFDVQESKSAAGLGLISMRERMEVIGGEFAIESTPGVGTSIRACVPVATDAPPLSNA